MTTPKLKLVSFDMCAYVQRARIILEEKNLEHEVEYIDLNMPPDWFYDVSPLEKVPVLLVDDEPLFESMVICEYLNDISGGDLYPDDAFERAKLKAWIALGDSILGTVYDFLQATSEPEFKRAKAVTIDRLDVLEDELAAGPYFSGAQFGMVDVAYAPLFRFLTGIAEYAGIDFYEDTPEVKAWAASLLAYPAVQASVPSSYEPALKAYLKRPETILATFIK
ncbi:MAG: glutathione S-transferase family protein [Thioalkalispiraceae bacterium]|jgi:glutathione S-transferase